MNWNVILSIISFAFLVSCNTIRPPSGLYYTDTKFGDISVDFNNKKMGLLHARGDVDFGEGQDWQEFLKGRLEKCDEELTISTESDMMIDFGLMPIEDVSLTKEYLQYLHEVTDLDLILSLRIKTIADDLSAVTFVLDPSEQNEVVVTLQLYDVNLKELRKEVTVRGKSKENSMRDVGAFQLAENKNQLIKGGLKRALKKIEIGCE